MQTRIDALSLLGHHPFIMISHPKPFSSDLQGRIDILKGKRPPIKLGNIDFSSPLLLAPMSAICNAPFRLLMEDLGSGGSVSELVSCHGINYGNQKTEKMLYVDPKEKHVGLQLFGEDAQSMAKAAAVAQEYRPQFIDINMGCPVRKVVNKGGGSALLKDTKKLASFFNQIKKEISLPLTIKIRTGWDHDSINAPEIINIAHNEGIEFVAVHGRTRNQQYTGQANWELLEMLAKASSLPIIGNGDLHSSSLAKQRLNKTACQALMLGRGPLRNPFIFLESFSDESSSFGPRDTLEVIERYYQYLSEYVEKERTLLVQFRKMIVWFVTGYPGVAKFRGDLFKEQNIETVIELTQEYLLGLEQSGQLKKQIEWDRPFMAGGHG
jgi:tRNA-dihydrouridine synthase B